VKPAKCCCCYCCKAPVATGVHLHSQLNRENSKVQPPHLAKLLLSGTGLLAGHRASARCPRLVGPPRKLTNTTTSMHLISSETRYEVCSSESFFGLPVPGEAAIEGWSIQRNLPTIRCEKHLDRSLSDPWAQVSQ
jgi:hypothetical protein